MVDPRTWSFGRVLLICVGWGVLAVGVTTVRVYLQARRFAFASYGLNIVDLASYLLRIVVVPSALLMLLWLALKLRARF
jgi:hypothetical protein